MVDEIAEDVLQETFLKIWNNFYQYNSKKGRLFTWIVNIARNQSIDKLRSKELTNQSRNKSYSKDDTLVNTHQISFDPNFIGLRQMVKDLEKDYSQIINILFFEGYSQSEAAEKLGIPLGTVKTRSRAALLQLRNQFEMNNVTI